METQYDHSRIEKLNIILSLHLVRLVPLAYFDYDGINLDDESSHGKAMRYLPWLIRPRVDGQPG